MRTASTWIVLLLLFLAFTTTLGQEPALNWLWTTEPIELAETGRIPREQMIAGHHNGVDILAGGSVQWTADSVQFYRDIYIRREGKANWEKQEQLLPKSGTGIFISTPDGLFCLFNQEILRLKWNEKEERLEQQLIPLASRIEFSKYNQQLLYADQKIYRHPPYYPDSNKLYLVTDLSTGKDWSTDQLPYSIEATSMGIIQGNGLHNCLYTALHSGLPSSALLEYNLFSNTHKKLSLPRNKGFINRHTINFPSGAAHQVFLGVGENRNQIWSYYTITNSWHALDTLKVRPLPHEKRFYWDATTIRLPAVNRQNELVLLQGIIPIQQQTFGTLNYFILFLYFLVLVLMGIYFSRRQTSTDDYFRGGGRIPWWAAGISIFGTALSAISFMAIPAKTFATDWAYLFNNLGPLYVAPIIALFFVPFFIRLDLSTAYEYLEKRFNLATRLLGSLSFIIYQIGRIGIVLYLPAIALNVVTGLDILFCIALMGTLSIIYTMMGGIEGVIWTDVLQVIILMGGGFLCLVILIFNTEGGLGAWWQTAVTDQKFNIVDARINWQEPTFIVVLLGGFFSNLVSYSTDQTFVQRYLTASDVGKAQKSVYTNALLMLPATLLFFALGTALYIFYQQNPAELQPGLSATDAIFPYFILSQLPQGVSGLLIAGVFAAAMSTLSSSMNSVASAYSNDFHARFGWRGSPMGVARWSTLVTGIIGTVFAMLMATSDIKSVWDEFLKIIGLITGGLGGIFVLGMVSKKANGSGALIGLLGSAIIQYWLGVTKPVHLLLFTATGFAAAVGIGWVASLFFDEEIKTTNYE